MASRHHYVSQFHLKGFTDPNVRQPQEPWLWVGDCATGLIQRRAPKKIAWSSGLYAGPGGLADRKSSLESFLAERVESPAAFALRALLSRPQGKRTSIPGELGRYMAWAAARSLSMHQIYQDWIDATPALNEMEYIEEPPPGLEQIVPISRVHRMEHPVLGVREDVPSEDVEMLRSQGWRLVLMNDDFLELVHLQAWYFQVRHFPRLRWVVLDAPPARHFVIGDRPVVWGFEGTLNTKPSALRHPDVQVFATLTRSLALFAHHPAILPPRSISDWDVNRVIASAAQNWIAGPTQEVVAEALSSRAQS